MPPKRPATTFTTDAPTDRAAAALAGKRVKFAPNNAEAVARADPGDADDLELDVEQGGGANKKRNVVTDGYDSDSSAGSDGGFGGAGGGRAGRGVGEQAAEPDDDEDDMFGGGPGVDKGMDIKGKKKEKEFLEMGDIEGQEFNKRDDDDDGEVGDEEDDEEELEEDYEPEDDLANDDDAPRSRRSKKGMGFQLSSFNMKEELNEGRFSADGSYVANKADPLANHDAWLSGVSKKSIKAAREAKERMDARAKQREEEDAKNEEQLTQLRDDCLIGLLSLVRPGESPAKALTRLGNAKKRADAAAAASSSSKDDNAMEVDDSVGPSTSSSTSANASSSSSSATLTPSARYAKKIDRLTHLASTLLSSHGELEIYDESYEDIIKTLKSEGAVRRDWVPPTDPDIEVEEREEREAKEKAAAEKAAAREAAGGRSRVVIARPGAGAGATSGGTTHTATTQYLYRWKEPPQGQPPEQEFGPYDRPTFEAWIAGGYFGDAKEADRVLVRKEGEQGWKSWKEVR